LGYLKLRSRKFVTEGQIAEYLSRNTREARA
jgi:hypothetical protein